MQVSEAIDQVTSFVDNVSPSDADDAARRSRILFWLIEEATMTYYAREWVWRLKHTESPHVVIAAGAAFGLLPTDFLSIGKLGAVYNDSQNGYALDPAMESEVADLVASTGHTVGSPRIFTVFGHDGAAPPRQKIWVGRVPSETALRLFYHPIMPTLDEAANNDNLDQACPAQYQQTVIIPGVRYRARRSKGDTRWTDDRDERMQGLNEMIRNNRRMQGGGQQLPSFFGD